MAAWRCAHRWDLKAGAAWDRSAFHQSRVAAEQANAADRGQRGFHPSAWRLVSLCAGRLIGGVSCPYSR